ncbi:ABC transporter ATP-binding protein [Paracoccus sulfuroxidans]|uniref:Peptide/nickel transport system ATP-binding protein n=1 Tax=Paracoccus sulfuroxidans TaxID=384678 RepID=A0A562NUH9_9RHOB|nr:ABC transporter ATP-binding protein [Paracoccus sulfuroxidans]TWI35852.1 peptide/nickel transport system ATP-binding protein [Paracoccus sulfuroxidans]
MSDLCRIEDLTVTYAGETRPALEAISLTLARGETLAVLGESGSGKTTLARAVIGLLPQGARVAGRIDWPGGAARPGRDIGYVFQDPGASLDPVLSIGAQLVEVLRAHRPLDRRRAREEAARLLARVQIPQPELALAAYPHQFSGGQRQRIAIALAIAGEPALLIADEATSALDTLVQAGIVALLRELVDEMGLSLMLVTHDIALAASLCQRILVLDHGRMAELGPARQVVTQPSAAITRQLLDSRIDLASPSLLARAP